jgi:hypothetical protein
MGDPMMPMLKKCTWKEFQDSKLLWWVNRLLHTFGWAIVLEAEDDGTILDAYPARCRFRGFDHEAETEGFHGLTAYLRETVDELYTETQVHADHVQPPPREIDPGRGMG